MKQIIFTALIIICLHLAAYAADAGAMKKLDGEWVVDVEASLAMNKEYAALSQEERAYAMRVGREFLSTLRFTFNSNDSVARMAFSFQAEEIADNVSVIFVSAENNKVTIKFDDELMLMIFKDDNTVLMVNQEDQSEMLLRRK